MTVGQEKDVTERMASLGAVAAGLAHEIKNPLVAIKTLAQLLPEKFDDPEFRNYFSQVVLDEVERINTLVSELLDFARPSLPRTELLNLELLVEDVVRRLDLPRHQGAVCLNKVFDEGLPPIQGNPVQLRQVLFNVLTNGIEAMPAEGDLEVRTAWEGGALLVIVTDSGAGIDDRDLPRIFEPFFTTKPSGTGLGLPLCKKIMEEHGGEIRVTNRPEGGTMVRLSFPFPDGR